MKTYNGYTNYETWKIQLEVVDYIDCQEEVSWTHLAALAEETIYEGVESKIFNSSREIEKLIESLEKVNESKTQ